MAIGKPKALLVGEKPLLRSNLAKHLEGRGCECVFAASYDEACARLRSEPCDLVLSPMRLGGMTLFPLMDLLDGSEATLFYFHLVEEGFWCLPALRQGHRCFGSSALRHAEFLSQLDELIDRLQMSRAPVWRSAASDSSATVEASAALSELLPPGSVRTAPALEKRKAGA